LKNFTFPLFALTIFNIDFMVVVFPAPFLPMKPTICPSSTLKLTLSNLKQAVGASFVNLSQLVEKEWKKT
jgi:hypothetical protein